MKVEPDTWLASVFGHDAFRVSAAGTDTSAVEAHVRGREGRKGFYYAKVPADGLAVVRALTAVGFHVVDVNMTFEREPGGDVRAPASTVREARAGDRDRLLEIAESCFVYSRF